MKNYVLYSLSVVERGKVSHRLAELTQSRFKIEEARAHSRDSEDRTRPYYGGRLPTYQCARYDVLRLPDDESERRDLHGLGEFGRLIGWPTRFSNKAYALFAPCDGDEEGISYIAGWFRTQAEAKECQTKGQLVLVMYKGSKISIGGDKPSVPVADLWGVLE